MVNVTRRTAASREQQDARSRGAGSVIALGAGIGILAGFVGGPVFGFAVGSATTFVLLRRSRSTGRSKASGSVGRQLPVALDLLAACLAAGAAPAQAFAAVGEAFDGEAGIVVSSIAKLVMLGAPVETAWATCLADPRWSPVARAVIRAHHSGAALTDVLVHLADDRRRALRTDAQAAAERAGIAIVLPLGACFLPAFVLVGVVPVVAGFAHALWS
ncbi:MAG TPA: type II secretion system F family protein [Acidothermaceae bacterium]